MDGRRMLSSLLVSLVLLPACSTVTDTPPTAAQARTMAVNGTTLTYIDQGQGPTVVMVHGAFSDARNWDGIRAIVAQRYRVVVPSLRYHHPNAWSDDGEKYSLVQHVDDMAALIRGLDVGKVDVVANSMGSRITAYLALRHPELVRSMVLGEPFVVVPTSAEAKAAITDWQKDAAQSAAAARDGDMQRSARLLYSAVLGDPQAFDKASPTVQQRTMDNARSMGPYSRQPAAPPVTCEAFGKLGIPALVVLGGSTRAVFEHGARTMAACLGDSGRLVVLPGGRHDWFAAMPEAGAKEILAFLERQR